MLILKFVVLILFLLQYFSVLHIYRIIFYNIYSIYPVYLSAFVLFSCWRLSESRFLVSEHDGGGGGSGGGISIGMVGE